MIVNTNHKIMSEVVSKVVQYSPNCILIIVFSRQMRWPKPLTNSAGSPASA